MDDHARPGEAHRKTTIFPFVPARRISHREIFRAMIAHEVRAGRLDQARRQRIVRYAAQLGLSAIEAGEMIEACRLEALESDDPVVREHGLRLVEAQPAWNFRAKLGLTLAGAVLVHLIFRAIL
jgi:hypothetical protein